jgi:spermidine synthase
MSSDPGFTPVTLSEAGGVRYLHLGTPFVQGAMQVRKPHRLVLEYVQRMLASLLWLDPSEYLDGRGRGHAVQLGMGAAAITRFTHKALRMPTTVVELNPMVIDVCRGWFHLPQGDPRLQVVQAEAGAWLKQAAPQSATLLHVDLYDHDAAAPVLDDAGFYADCRALLADDGVFSVNLFGRRASFDRSAARIAQAFGAARVWRLRPTREGNAVVVAARALALPDPATLRARAATIESRFGSLGLPALKWLRMLRPYQGAPSSGSPR